MLITSRISVILCCESLKRRFEKEPLSDLQTTIHSAPVMSTQAGWTVNPPAFAASADVSFLEGRPWFVSAQASTRQRQTERTSYFKYLLVAVEFLMALSCIHGTSCPAIHWKGRHQDGP